MEKDHPSQDTTGRFQLDSLIRPQGYRIHSRRNTEEPIWEKQGIKYLQSEVLDRLDKDDVHKAKETERTYYRHKYRS